MDKAVADLASVQRILETVADGVIDGNNRNLLHTSVLSAFDSSRQLLVRVESDVGMSISMLPSSPHHVDVLP